MHLVKKEKHIGKVNSMNLFLVHTGFYDENNSDGFYEQHSNILVVANNVFEAKENVKKNNHFIDKNMHIDGIKQINVIDGYRIKPIKTNSKQKKHIDTFTHRQVQLLKPT